MGVRFVQNKPVDPHWPMAKGCGSRSGSSSSSHDDSTSIADSLVGQADSSINTSDFSISESSDVRQSETGRKRQLEMKTGDGDEDGSDELSYPTSSASVASKPRLSGVLGGVV